MAEFGLVLQDEMDSGLGSDIIDLLNGTDLIQVRRGGRRLQPGDAGRVVETLDLTLQGDLAQLRSTVNALDAWVAKVRDYNQKPYRHASVCLYEEMEGEFNTRLALIHSMERFLQAPVPLVAGPASGESDWWEQLYQLTLERDDRWENETQEVVTATPYVYGVAAWVDFGLPNLHWAEMARLARTVISGWSAESEDEALDQVWIGMKHDGNHYFDPLMWAYEGTCGDDTTTVADADCASGYKVERLYVASEDMDFVASGSIDDFHRPGTVYPDGYPGEYLVLARMHAQNSVHYVRLGTAMSVAETFDDRVWAWQRPVRVDTNAWSYYPIGRLSVGTLPRLNPFYDMSGVQWAMQCQRDSGSGQLWLDDFILLPLQAFAYIQSAALLTNESMRTAANLHVTRTGEVYGIAASGSALDDPWEWNTPYSAIDTRGLTARGWRLDLPDPDTGDWALVVVGNRKDGLGPITGTVSVRFDMRGGWRTLSTWEETP